METPTIDKAFAERFAQQWVSTLNRHDLDELMSYYADDFEMSSPVIIQIVEEASGTLKGKDRFRAFLAKGIDLSPDFHIELEEILMGVNSVTLYYKNMRGRVGAEVFHFNMERKVEKAFAHYAF